MICACKSADADADGADEASLGSDDGSERDIFGLMQSEKEEKKNRSRSKDDFEISPK